MKLPGPEVRGTAARLPLASKRAFAHTYHRRFLLSRGQTAYSYCNAEAHSRSHHAHPRVPRGIVDRPAVAGGRGGGRRAERRPSPPPPRRRRREGGDGRRRRVGRDRRAMADGARRRRRRRRRREEQRGHKRDVHGGDRLRGPRLFIRSIDGEMQMADGRLLQEKGCRGSASFLRCWAIMTLMAHTAAAEKGALAGGEGGRTGGGVLLALSDGSGMSSSGVCGNGGK